MHHPDPNEKSHQQRMVKKDAVMRRLLAATLSVSSLWQLMPPTAAAQVTPLTAAATPISNTATGRYEDPNNPGVPINTTSNTVTATVAEVAGVTNDDSGLVDLNLGSITTNDAINATFVITNTGNDVTAFHIPSVVGDLGLTGVSLGTTGSNATTGTLAPGVYVTKINGVTLANPVILPTSGNTNDPAFIANVQGNGAGQGNYTAFDGTVNPTFFVEVIVPVTVTETIAGNPVSVRLGNTGANDNTSGTQNQPDSGTEPTTVVPIPTGPDPVGASNEVYTINPATGIAGLPVNGPREASAFQTAPLATQVNNLALATVLKVRSAYSQAGTPATLTDDLLTYRLDLRVEGSPPTGSTGITTAPLLGTAITVDATSQIRILVSDAVPAGTNVDLAFTPVLPAGWTRVYTTSPTTTSAVDAAWSTTAPAAASITRVGFVFTPNLSISGGTSTIGDANGFQFRVVTNGISNTSATTITNIAQVIGRTTPTGTTLVYDESGDQNPNNFDGPNPPATPITTTTVPAGVAGSNGTDTNNNNTGTGVGGEDNIFPINPPGIILNGPPSQPGALGPDNTNNTDFVNKSTVDVPADTPSGQPVVAYDPAPIVFSNTVQNPPTNSNQLDNVTLEPISATLAAKAVNNTATPTAAQINAFDLDNLPNHDPLPNGTTVLIAFGGRGAVYTLTGGEFVLSSSGPAVPTGSGATLAFPVGSGTGDATAAPVIIPSLARGDSANYNVVVNLPSGVKVTEGYSVPIVSYVNSNTGDGSTFKTTGTLLAEDNPFNIKSDRVYTGFLDLLKESRVLPGTGPALSVAGDASFSTTPKRPAPGNILEYRITYRNISTPNSGSGNLVLNASNIVITEDGTAGTNNWATTTLNVPSTAADSTPGSVITFFNGAASAFTTDTLITRYLNSVPTLAPSLSGIFGFQRQVK